MPSITINVPQAVYDRLLPYFLEYSPIPQHEVDGEMVDLHTIAQWIKICMVADLVIRMERGKAKYKLRTNADDNDLGQQIKDNA